MHRNPANGRFRGWTDRSLPRVSTDATTPTSIVRALVAAVVAVGVFGAAIVVAAKTVSTSSARVAASTSSDGFLTAGTVLLERADGSTSLFFDADDLYPGRVVAGCIALDYAGSVPAAIRLHGDPGVGTGLDAYVDLQLTTLSGDACPVEAELVDAPAERALPRPTERAVGGARDVRDRDRHHAVDRAR